MANQYLQGRCFIIPSTLMEYLNRLFERYKYSKEEKGYKRLKTLIEDNKITYENLKRIKNFFDTFKGSKQDIEYILNGGDRMKLWINNCLSVARNVVETHKNRLADVGLSNTHKKEHEKDSTTNFDKTRIPRLDKSTSSKDLYNNNVNYESIYKQMIFNKELITEIYKQK